MRTSEVSEIQATDIAYACPDTGNLLMRLFHPPKASGHGVVMVHGGAWTSNDRTTPWVMCEALAAEGMLVASLDFRCGPDFQHPTASADIAAGVRYIRAHAREFEIDPDTLGLIGSSSGGHLVLLTALKPDVPEHMTTPILPRENEDDGFYSAEVLYVVALWPVSDPPARYRYAQESGRRELVAAHDGYFGSLDRMQHASVQRVLMSGEATHVPPVMIVQPGEDANVPEAMTLDLVTSYQARNGSVQYRYLPDLPHAFAYQPSTATDDLSVEVLAFIRRHIAET
ncbi:MAG: alpha/beta hydrolase [Pseudomonadales bacterium]|nr:alpha/beta hydrolase [Pseudomonadales bacterium]